MSVIHMNAEQFSAFKAERKAKPVSVPAPAGVTVMNMTHDVKGIVVAIDDGKGGAHVIGDTIGIYLGDDPPDYFA